VTWTFIADCMNTLFFNSPPQMMMSEMSGDLPCMDAVFEASTAVEFEQLSDTSADSDPVIPALNEWISSLLQENWIGANHPSVRSIEPGHLLISIFGKYVPFFSRIVADEPVKPCTQSCSYAVRVS
jgi:hypothetical protein